jgi:hypothetical protein
VSAGDLDGFWPSRRLDAFDQLCLPAAPLRAAVLAA